MTTAFAEHAWGDSYTWQAANNQLSTTTTFVTINEVIWSFNPTWNDNSKKYVSWQGGSSNWYQIGSSKNVLTALSLSTEDISGTITSVEVIWSSAGSNDASLAVSVGSTEFTTNSGTSSSSTLQTSTYTGSGSGILALNFSCTTGIKFQKVTVIYTPSTAPQIKAPESISISHDATSGSFTYNLINPVTGTSLNASTSNTWISNVTVGDDEVTFDTEANTSTEVREGTITLTYGTITKNVTIAQGAFAADYVELPFTWEGGASSDLIALTGVTASGLGSDYAAGNAPYLVKFDGTGDYIQFKTNERPGIVTIGVKMLGGDNTSSFTVKESADGEEFTDLQSLSISGRQNDVLTLETTQAFAETTRYLRLYFTKGSNVGVGPISIAQYADIVLENYTLTIANPDNVTISAAYGVDGILVNGDSEEITQGTEITLTVNPAEGYDFESVTITGEEGQSLTPTTTSAEGVYTFAMPAYNATVSATVIEHIDPVFASYTLAESITSGKHYVITSGIEGDIMVMGNQGNNNRSAVGATTISDDGVLTISDEYEVLIEGNVKDGFVILDDKGGDQGCLYAASSSNNYLRTQSTNNKNGLWYIQIIDEETPPVIYATGINTRNYLRFNSSNNLFSCYGLNEDNQPGQAPIYLFERTEEDIPQTVTITLNRNLRTYAGRYDLDFTNVEGLKAYYPTELGEDYKLTMVEPTSPVMAGCGLMLSGTAGASYEVPVALNFGNLIERNLLVGLLERTTVNKTQDDQTTLILSAAGSNGLNWYAMSKDGELKANSAYLLLPTADLPEDGDGTRLTMDFGCGSNGISVASVKQNTNTWFTIDGRQLKAKPASKGIYVNNGKKVVIK